MRKVKSLTAVILIICLVLSLGACKKDKDANADTENTSAVSETDTVKSEDTTLSETQTAQAKSTEKKPAETKAAVNSPAEPEGSGGVEKITDTYNSVGQTVYYPKNLTVSSKTYPVIVWANGTAVQSSFYENLLKEFADGGYIVVANNETMSADGKAQISSMEYILSQNENQSSVFYRKVNTDKIGAAGHSQGGRSSVNAAAADGRFDCVLSIAGSNFKEEAEKLSAPALFLTGTRDMVVTSAQWVKPAYDVCKGPAVYASLVNGIHTSCTSEPSVYSGYAVKWFNLWLKGDSGAKQTFVSGGELACDSAWTDFTCKGM